MLSENAIDALMEPIIERQESINNYVIQTIAERVKEIGHLLPSDVYKLERILKSGGDVKKINKEIARLTGLNERDIKRLIRTVAQDYYKDAKRYYDYRKLPYIPFEENKPLQTIVAAIAKQTANTYINISNARAFMIRDLKNPGRLVATPLSKTYYSVVDEAIQAVQSGTLDFNTAMRRTMRQLADSGIRYVEYDAESGRKYTQRLDTAVRRNLLDGIRQVGIEVQDELGKQYGATGKEITVHANSAPDHEPIQGHQFTNEEFDKLQNHEDFQDVDGNKFDGLERVIGQYNCYHVVYSIIVGVSKPTYTKARLQAMIDANKKGYTTSDGRHMTMYECTQEQRKLETKIREQKERQMAFQASGDLDAAREAQAKMIQYQKQYKAFSQSCGLKVRKDRMAVSNYRRIK